MADLSPAAQAVLDAFNREARPEPHHQREAIAAALRAVAAAHCEAVEIRTGSGTGEIDVIVRESRILAIAAELEAQ